MGKSYSGARRESILDQKRLNITQNNCDPWLNSDLNKSVKDTFGIKWEILNTDYELVDIKVLLMLILLGVIMGCCRYKEKCSYFWSFSLKD